MEEEEEREEVEREEREREGERNHGAMDSGTELRSHCTGSRMEPRSHRQWDGTTDSGTEPRSHRQQERTTEPQTAGQSFSPGKTTKMFAVAQSRQTPGHSCHRAAKLGTKHRQEGADTGTLSVNTPTIQANCALCTLHSPAPVAIWLSPLRPLLSALQSPLGSSQGHGTHTAWTLRWHRPESPPCRSPQPHVQPR